MWLDATVAMDDAFTERFLTCLVCGQRQGQRSLDLVQVGGGLPLMITRCLRCASQDRTGAALIAHLTARERTTLKDKEQ